MYFAGRRLQCGVLVLRASDSSPVDVLKGIAYALYPRVTADTEQGDLLVEDLVRMQLRGTPASDRFLQFDQLAVVIRPLLKASLAHNETISDFLPKAIAE